MLRSDLKLFAAREQLAARIVRDSSKDWWPSLDAIFQPTTLYPSQFFLPQNSWRLLLQANVPIFDSGQRGATKTLREADLAETKATLTGARTQASAEVRTAREAVASSERSLASARAAASQAHQVVDITSFSYRAGGATNIEVIDAERTARDNDLAVAIAEDRVRPGSAERARAVSLVALESLAISAAPAPAPPAGCLPPRGSPRDTRTRRSDTTNRDAAESRPSTAARTSRGRRAWLRSRSCRRQSA
jgi:outer membrane protein TolC